jgi:hypothetical protein
LYQSNKDQLPTGADHRRAAERLIAWAPNRQAMPGDIRDKFEREALTASGWTEAPNCRAFRRSRPWSSRVSCWFSH